MNKLYFVAPYVSEFAGRSLSCTPSSITYSNYFINSFSQLKDKELIVLSLCASKKRTYFSKKKVNLNNHTEVYFRSLSTGWGTLITRITQIWLYLQVFFYLFVHSKKQDTIVIYHDYGLSYFYRFFRFFLRSRIVYLVGEIFNAVYDRGESSINKECQRLINADAYIYVNDIMPRLFNNTKDFAVCYGNYSYCGRQKLKDGTTHILFAGKISTGIINDAFIALDVIKYLPSDYFLHVAGYGEDKDIEELQRRVGVINSEAGIKRVTYEGNLSGREYEDLLAKCQIGLCTRTLRNELSNYCFPSKTMVYLTHNILPICPRIDILVSSRVSSQLAFVKGDLTPEGIANTILEENGRINGYNNKELLESIDKAFRDKIKNIINC